MKHAHNDMRIKVKASFMNPKTTRLAQVGEVFNVPKNQFWLKRLMQKDIEETKDDVKIAQPKIETQPVENKKSKIENKSKSVSKPAKASVSKASTNKK